MSVTVQNARRILLILHERPDWDCIVASFLWLLANMVSLLDSRVQIKFVPPGQRFSEPIHDDDMVVHLDTGRLFNPDTNDFDHHLIGASTQLHSAAQAVWNNFGVLLEFKWLSTLLQLTNEIDSGHRCSVRNPQLMEEKLDLNDKLRTANMMFLSDWRIIDLRDNLQVLVNFFAQIPRTRVSDNVKVYAGIALLFGWHHWKLTGRTETQQTIDHNLVAEFLERIGNKSSLTVFPVQPNPETEPCKTVHRKHWELFREYSWLANLCRMTLHGRETDQEELLTELKVIDERMREINAAHGVNLQLIQLREQLFILNEMLRHIPLNDDCKLTAGMAALYGWHQQRVGYANGGLRDLVESSRMTQVNGLTFLLIDEPIPDRKQLRNGMRRNPNYRETIDVYIFPDGEDGDLGVTCVEDSRVAGMRLLTSILRNLSESKDPNDIFLHEPTNFTLYLKAATGITQETLESLAIAHLQRAMTEDERAVALNELAILLLQLQRTMTETEKAIALESLTILLPQLQRTMTENEMAVTLESLVIVHLQRAMTEDERAVALNELAILLLQLQRTMTED